MKIQIAAPANEEIDEFITQKTRQYNKQFVDDDYQPLSVHATSENGDVVGGLVGKTYWNYLEVEFLWVEDAHRRQGLAAKIMAEAEREARQRRCHTIILDTYEFQALGFYERIGFQQFGQLDEFAGRFKRYYLKKTI